MKHARTIEFMCITYMIIILMQTWIFKNANLILLTQTWIPLNANLNFSETKKRKQRKQRRLQFHDTLCDTLSQYLNQAYRLLVLNLKFMQFYKEQEH